MTPVERIIVKALKRSISKITGTRYLATKNNIQTSGDLNEWNEALPIEDMPGPSKLSVLLSILPGGKYHNVNQIEFFKSLKRDFGNICFIPGIFGQENIIVTFNPDDFEKIYRTEGRWPIRYGTNALTHFRTVEKSDFFSKAAGLDVDQDKAWATFRSKVNPILLKPKSLTQYLPVVNDVANDFVLRIKDIKDAKTKEVPQTFEEEIYKWAFESVGVITLDRRFGIINEYKSKDLKQAIETFKQFFKLSYEVEEFPYYPFLSKSKFRNIMEVQDELLALISGYINETTEDLLQNPDKFGNSVLGQLLLKDSHVAHVMALDMFMVGIETTSYALIACLFQLAKNQEKQNKLREEIKTILPSNESKFTAENMQYLPYLRACIKETLRINPVASINARTTRQDVILSGYQVPSDSNVYMPSHILQNEEINFIDAEKFIPERWLPDDTGVITAKNAHPFIYLPFGFGPRNCVGKRVAEMELEVVLGKIIKHFHVEYNYPDFSYLSHTVNVPTGDFKFKFVDLC